MIKHIFLLGMAVIMTACTAPEAVYVSGSSTVLPPVSKAADMFTAETGISVIVNAGGSGGGFNQLAEGQTDIGMMSRNITAAELEAFNHLSFTEIAIGRDAVVPSISSEIYNAGVKSLTLSQIANIYTGDIKNWREVGGPDRDIFVIDKEVSRGTRQVFMDVILGDPKAEALGADLVTGSNNEEQTALVQSDAAIGMLSVAWLNDDVRGLSIVLDDGTLVEPSIKNIRAGTYPFVRDLNGQLSHSFSPIFTSFRNRKLQALQLYALACGGISLIIFLTIIGTLFMQSMPVLLADNTNLIGTSWNPGKGEFGILPMLFGSIFVMMIAVTVALPLGLLAAIYIAETKSSKFRRILKSLLELLAGIPSIVYGLIGVAYLNIWIADLFDLQSGRIILTAGILLGIMILPTFLTLTEDAISAVPVKFRENAKSLGLYRHEVFFSVILPQAKTGIAGAGLLALGRALGETMAVMLVIGSLDRLPKPLFNPLSSGQTITSKLGREVPESAFGRCLIHII